MSLPIASNINSLKLTGNVSRLDASHSSSIQRLSSGQRINRASDDPAGQALATTLRNKSQLARQGITEVSNGISVVNVTSAALDQLTSLVTRQRELAEQAANGVYSADQRSALNNEAAALTAEYTRIVESTTFNGIRLLSGDRDSISLQHGLGSDNSTTFRLPTQFATAQAEPEGTFGAAATLDVGGSTFSVAAADFDQDGSLDLVSTSYGAAVAAVFFNNGDGTFQARVTLATGDGPFSVTAVDVNNDLVPDIITSDLDDSSFSIFINNGNGTFQAPLSVGTAPERYIISADVDKDGNQDVIGANSSNALTLYYGNGDGTFEAGNALITTSTFHQTVIAADLDGDTWLDLAATSSANDQIVIFMNNGDGTFPPFVAPTLSTGDSPNGLTSADVDGDTILDLISTEHTDGDLNIFIGNGDGTFQSATTIAAGIGTNAVEAADIDGDSDVDLISVENSSHQLSVFTNDGSGSFQLAYTIATGLQPELVLARDVSGDGILDLVSADQASEQLSVFLGSGSAGSTDFDIDLTSVSGSRAALTTLEARQTQLSSAQGQLGASTSRLEVIVNNLASLGAVFDESYSRITDADLAEEVAKSTSLQVVRQNATALLAQANQQSQLALRLLL